MQIEQLHIEAFEKAETLMLERDYRGYLELKELLSDPTPLARNRFRTLFTNYYGMNTGGLSDDFKDRFFEILFSGLTITDGEPQIAPILHELSLIPDRRGYCAMPFSFVSKLVGIHMENSPIYDKHVTTFFAVGAPGSSVPKSSRINWYLDFLRQVKSSYSDWALDHRVGEVLNRFRMRDPRLADCHRNRLLDFLVWKVGNQKLLK